MNQIFKRIVFFFILFSITLHAQEVNTEIGHPFKSLKTDSYLGHVDYDSESEITSLYYVEKNVLKSIFTTYRFDKDLQFIDEKIEEYSLTDQVEDAVKNFSWFSFKGDELIDEIIMINSNLKGELIARKARWVRTYNWNFGLYIPKFEYLDEVKIKGLDGDRIYLYDRFYNRETEENILLLGIKPPKGETKNARFQHARKFQLLKINSNLEAEFGEIIEFDTNRAISFIGNLTSNLKRENSPEMDLSQGNISIVLTPVKSLLGKKWQSDHPEKHTMLVINAEGKIESRIDYDAPTSGWVIQDLVVSNNGQDVYYFGPAKDGSYVNMLTPTKSPLTSRSETKDIKFKNFQVMKISNNQLEWINNTDLKDFKAKSVTPPSQRKSPDYIGKNFINTLTYVTQSGELFIAGQKFKTDDTNEKNPDGSSVLEYTYKDLVMFHFDSEGGLKSQYGIKREKNNKHAKSQLTPQYLYENKEGNQVYWVYGEIKGLRFGLEVGNALKIAGVNSISKRKLLFYPTVAKIDLEKGKMGDFVPLGANADGKQKYFTNPAFPQFMTADQSKLIFIGEDRKGSLVWLANMNIE